MARLHVIDRRDWPRLTWRFPRIHNFEFGFGLSADEATKNSTIVPYVFSDNAMVDLNSIKTNPQNSAFAVYASGNVHQESYIPNIRVNWVMYIPASDTELVHVMVDTMQIHTAMLNRLDAKDKKTGEDIESLLELQHETTDEQVYPLFANVKLYEGGGTFDYHADQPGLTTDQQPESVAFDKEPFFDAMHYYTNKQMLKQVTGGMRNHMLSEPIIPHGRSIITGGMNSVPSMCKSGNPYMGCFELFHVPLSGSRSQYHIASETSTAKEHVRVKGFVRFNEYNPDYDFGRASA